ncbi:histidine biosynthesis bifunctional protein (HISIE) [Artemisia annua]|uniref:phosphoribosyl-ATP diphosphatase n=1 Tax=Artemisia annua TaxID=35608 RepID=A0A2U1PGP8_ARTAN|nr:histidine biosynthesis bifunctional protein (HISIE) [Artemisia annua]
MEKLSLGAIYGQVNKLQPGKPCTKAHATVFVIISIKRRPPDYTIIGCCYTTFCFVKVKENNLALTTLYSLESTLAQRKEELSAPQEGKPSWTKHLLLDDKLLCSKIREEADEFCRILEENEDESRTVSEMADVLYHEMVLLTCRGLKFEEVLEVLRRRFSQSGVEEKNSRKAKMSSDE